MNHKLNVVFLILLCFWRMSAVAWGLSTEEKQVLCTNTVCYSIDKPGWLRMDMASWKTGAFDRLEVMALKDKDGRPDLPYRIKVYNGNQAHEFTVLSVKSHTWKTVAEQLMVDQNPILDFSYIKGVGDAEKMVSDGIAKLEEKDGRVNVELLTIRSFDDFECFDISTKEMLVRIPGLGERAMQWWCLFDEGLRFKQCGASLMKPNPGLRSWRRQEYVCAWACYQTDQTKSGWVKAASGEELPFIVKVRIWNAEDKMTRTNALCIAEVSGIAKMNAKEPLTMVCEKGEKDFRAEIVNGLVGEHSRILRLYYKDAQTSVYFGAKMSGEELMDFETKLKASHQIDQYQRIE